jgi:hypothetical protein
MIVMTQFIHDNPQLREMFDNNFPNLLAHLNGPQLKTIYNSMLEQSGAILHAMDTGGTVTANIGDGASLHNVELTQEDRNNINSLVKMGFNGAHVTEIYINSGKNFDATLEQLLMLAGM